MRFGRTAKDKATGEAGMGDGAAIDVPLPYHALFVVGAAVLVRG